jgi:hypothetical protein
LVVELRNDCPELGQLLSEDHITLGIRHSITVNDVVGGLHSLVALLKATDSLTDKSTHLSVDDLSTLRDKKIVGVVLTHLLVGRGCKANDRLSTRVAHVNTNQHGARCFNYFWELHVEQVTADFTVHLADDVRSFGGVEGPGISAGDHLRRDPVLVEHELVHGVVPFHTQESESNCRMTELLAFLVNEVLQ